MRIGILDDEAKARETVLELCQRYSGDRGESLDFELFETGEELLQYCNSEDAKRLDLLFLDVEMPGEDGIQIKQYAENLDKVFRVVFITNHDEVISEAFGFKVLKFLKKPVSYEMISNEIRKVSHAIEKNKRIILEDEAFFLEDLEYIEGKGNYIIVNLKNKVQKIIVKQIGVLEREFSGIPVIRVHKSYMVNLMEVLEITDKVVLKREKKQIPLGRKYSKATKEIFLEFKKKQMRGRME